MKLGNDVVGTTKVMKIVNYLDVKNYPASTVSNRLYASLYFRIDQKTDKLNTLISSLKLNLFPPLYLVL